MSDLNPLRAFVETMTCIADRGGNAAAQALAAEQAMRRLVARDGWLPDGFDRAPPESGFGQRLLWCDPRQRFSVVCFCWGEGRRTPVHDHRAWGVVGVLRGAEVSVEMRAAAAGSPMREGRRDRCDAGQTIRLGPPAVLPGAYDVHCVENAAPAGGGVAIHVYGSNIGALPRGIYAEETGACAEFVSGYDNAWLPNVWRAA